MAKQTIYLTIDDGPSDLTALFLDLLEKYNSRATFFVLGENIEGHQSDIKRICAQGHAIGVHGYCHDYDVVYQSCKVFWEDNLRARKMIEELTGKTPWLMRFQGGSSNTVSRHYCKGIMRKLTRQAASYGYVYHDWNIDSEDWKKQYSAEEILKYIKAEIHDGSYSRPLILLHDRNDLNENVMLVERLLHDLTSEGYTFSVLSKDIIPIHYRVSN